LGSMLDKKTVAPMVANVINQCNGMNIGTTLQDTLETRINRIIASENWTYVFHFNMSGQTEHFFFDENGDRQDLFD